ncbi:MAG: type II toxin-antitoxin system VapC family toxin [Bacteroidetes bacterium]|nr:type II toxin-antitoxin system VapC family toxin [Bacteroidota bacterium]
MNKVLIDTNVLIYTVDADSQYHHQSQGFLFNSANELFTTSKNISEFLSVITRGKNPVSIENAIKAADDFLTFIKILFPAEHSHIRFKKLLLRYKPSGLSVHDFEIAAIALSNNISQIATFNYNDCTPIKEITLIKL